MYNEPASWLLYENEFQSRHLLQDCTLRCAFSFFIFSLIKQNQNQEQDQNIDIILKNIMNEMKLVNLSLSTVITLCNC